ncbi:Eukaryotic translation initiation factor-like protein [Melia azedarach]|uniref:Eukaryotic translation initiation factor-like protein n=1 Tax=Melia azedarach TaxID=155640 RepID=A0ACC1Z4N1_MELAZ|nr:Eukaryotic translation initiation factor-like protein [Melia azedarach]
MIRNLTKVHQQNCLSAPVRFCDVCVHFYGVVYALHLPLEKRFQSLPPVSSLQRERKKQGKKMSKKKTLSTMSLKDFHGGSIPSDLALPSAPGVLARSDSDRSMSTNWGNNLGRSDLRPRPKSSGAGRNIDEKPLVLSHSAPIGQNFDEEERKPLNSVFASRQTVSNESVRTSSPIHPHMKLANMSSVRISDRSVSSPSLVTSHSPLRVNGGNHFAVSSQTPINNNGKGVNLNIPIGNNGQGVNNSQPNAWGVRKEFVAVEETSKPSLLSGPDALSKISQASALEKVSSGMWQSKKPSQLLPHSLYSRDNSSNVFGNVDVFSERTDYNVVQGGQVERGPVAEDQTKGGGRELSKMYIDEVHIGPGKGGSLLSQATSPEISEQVNSRLHQRSGPLETSENDIRQSGITRKVESGNELDINTDSLKTVANVTEGGSQMVKRPVERPKLNLKPRSQPLNQSDGRLERERETLFGGGRPRELVLKERGIDEIAISNLDIGNEPSRVNNPKNEAASERSVPSTQHNQNAENLAYEKRIGKNLERKERPTGQGKDNQWRNRRIENRWGSADAEKQQQDRRPEPDTWRKPVEEGKPTSDDSSGIHHGKIVSPLDLAKAFSKSVSDPMCEENSSQRGLPGHDNQMPFSRLTDTHQLNSATTARHRINGY